MLAKLFYKSEVFNARATHFSSDVLRYNFNTSIDLKTFQQLVMVIIIMYVNCVIVSVLIDVCKTARSSSGCPCGVHCL